MSEDLDIAFALFEQHPGFGEWGQRWAKPRGFLSDDITEILRAELVLPARPMVGDHIEVDGDDYIVSYVRWHQFGACEAYAKWNGECR